MYREPVADADRHGPDDPSNPFESPLAADEGTEPAPALRSRAVPVGAAAFVLASVAALLLLSNFDLEAGAVVGALALLSAIGFSVWRRSAIARAIAVAVLWCETLCVPIGYFNPHRIIGQRGRYKSEFRPRA